MRSPIECIIFFQFFVVFQFKWSSSELFGNPIWTWRILQVINFNGYVSWVSFLVVDDPILLCSQPMLFWGAKAYAMWTFPLSLHLEGTILSFCIELPLFLNFWPRDNPIIFLVGRGTFPAYNKMKLSGHVFVGGWWPCAWPKTAWCFINWFFLGHINLSPEIGSRSIDLPLFINSCWY